MSFASKGDLVEGGIPVPVGFADHELQKAAAKGSLPLTFNITNIVPSGPGAATATVTASGPHLAPTPEYLTVRRSGRLEALARLGMTLISARAFALTAACMRRSLAAVLSTAAIAAALGLPGCSSDEDGASPESAPASTSASLSPTAAPHDRAAAAARGARRLCCPGWPIRRCPARRS